MVSWSRYSLSSGDSETLCAAICSSRRKPSAGYSIEQDEEEETLVETAKVLRNQSCMISSIVQKEIGLLEQITYKINLNKIILIITCIHELLLSERIISILWCCLLKKYRLTTKIQNLIAKKKLKQIYQTNNKKA